MKTLPSKLKTWRRRRGLTQSAAAFRLGANARTFEAWEAGRHTPRGLALKTLINLIKEKD